MRQKIILLSSLVCCFALQSKAQLADGSIAPDWTLSDINGTSHHLYSDLNSGKAVYIDVSATWCNPCWVYHNSGELENLWVSHGPSGGTNVSGSTTNDVMVYLIEGDGATGTNALNGISGVDGSTQGNWVTGTSHPIIDPSAIQIGQFNTNYSINAFPTVFMVCPDKTIKNTGAVSATSQYTAKSTCATSSIGIDARMLNVTAMNPNLSGCDSVTPTVILSNMGTVTLTSALITFKVDGVTQKTFNWTGNLATYEYATINTIKVGAGTSGSHVLTLIVSNPNAGTDVVSSNNSTTLNFNIYPSVGVTMPSETFESGSIPSSWIIDNGGNTLNFGVAPFGYNSSQGVGINWFGSPVGNIETMMIGAPISFTGVNYPALTFDVSYAQRNTSTNDQLIIEVSSDCGGTWTTVYDKSGATLATVSPTTAGYVPAMPTNTAQWRNEFVNLYAFANQSNVSVRFKGVSALGNNLFLDNINFSATSGLVINEENISLNIFPNPSSKEVILQFNSSTKSQINILDSKGQILYSQENEDVKDGNQNVVLNVENFVNGFYFVNIISGENIISQKLTIIK
ncbi:MAG: T9SS type A sorting domain-containing protein [Flavobacteriia bacterium]|nr:T9SS type A sorting domain-containing protein [Flavobacteriia bacterium]